MGINDFGQDKRLAKSKIRELSFEYDPTPEAAFTDVDFLLNTSQLEQAFSILLTVKATLLTTYSALQRSVN